MKICTAYSPSHITGLFVPHRSRNLLMAGSQGAGVSLEKGILTKVEAEKSGRWKTRVHINGMPAKADVSLTVVKEFSKLTDVSYDVSVEHSVQVPIGAGFGASGAGALSLALALNEALDTGLSRIEATQIAHIAEIKCKTGLGTVLAEAYGGVEIRYTAGAPGIGSVKQIQTSDAYVVSLCLGSLSTKSMLSNSALQKKVTKLGGKLLLQLLEEPLIRNFIQLSREFSEGVNLYTPRLRTALDSLDAFKPKTFTMNMFGEAVFSLVEESMLEPSVKFLGGLKTGGEIIVSSIDKNGARLV